jgi:hypothetical protein
LGGAIEGEYLDNLYNKIELIEKKYIHYFCPILHGGIDEQYQTALASKPIEKLVQTKYKRKIDYLVDQITKGGSQDMPMVTKDHRMVSNHSEKIDIDSLRNSACFSFSSSGTQEDPDKCLMNEDELSGFRDTIFIRATGEKDKIQLRKPNTVAGKAFVESQNRHGEEFDSLSLDDGDA